MRDEQPPDPGNAELVARKSRHGSAPAGIRGWWARLPFTPKIAAITAGLLMLCWGGFGLVGLFTAPPTSGAGASSGQITSGAESTPEDPGLSLENPGPTLENPDPTLQNPGPTPTTAPGTTASGTPGREPVIQRRIVTETQTIAFDTEEVRDNTVFRGTEEVRTAGVPGIRTLTYELTFTDGVQTAKVFKSSAVTREPVTEVIAIGTKPPPRCNPNYEGACVPIASDVDCEGTGDGPAWVEGPVQVTGEDIYGLDPDGDGVGCDT